MHRWPACYQHHLLSPPPKKIAILAIFRGVFKDVFVTFHSKKKLYFAGKCGKLNPKVFNLFKLLSLYSNFEEIVVLVLTLTHGNSESFYSKNSKTKAKSKSNTYETTIFALNNVIRLLCFNLNLSFVLNLTHGNSRMFGSKLLKTNPKSNSFTGKTSTTLSVSTLIHEQGSNHHLFIPYFQILQTNYCCLTKCWIWTYSTWQDVPPGNVDKNPGLNKLGTLDVMFLSLCNQVAFAHGKLGGNPSFNYKYCSNLLCKSYHKFTNFTSVSYCFNCTGITNYELLKQHGDVESNPGPSNTGKLLIGTYNISGCKKYCKMKRITTWLFKNKKVDRFIFSLQETHVSNNEFGLAQSLWREGLVLSPSNGRARGVLTFFSNGLFEDILLLEGSKDGRSTWVVGTYNNYIDLFVSIYSPNSGKNAEFYTSFFAKLNSFVNRFKVDNVYISGDFNLVLYDDCVNRTQSAYEKKLCQIIKNEVDLLGLKCVNGHGKYTWSRSNKYSTLDYIFIPKHCADTNPEVLVNWAIDRSDHAAVQALISFDLDKGRGMFRPNLSFLDCIEHRTLFEAELFLVMNQTDPEWDPHTKLEFAKVMMRTKVAEFSIKYGKKVEDRHRSITTELNKIHEIRSRCINNSSHPLLKYCSIEDIDRDLASLELDLDSILQDKTKMLAAKSRIKWLEFGEKSNKYFLNLNKSFQNKSYFKSFIVDGTEVLDSAGKIKAVYNFYSKLYEDVHNEDPQNFLDRVETGKLSLKCNESLQVPLVREELTNVLKSCGDTASGPDGISYKLLKSCWSFYGDILIDSWNYGIETGILAPSHRESVICLIGKKGKDKREIGNLRPITLSNCDIKIITKAITKRCNNVVNKALNPHQTAYIPGRSVHDNLRLIDIAKDLCNKHNTEGYLVSLDAKKAFDSVDHKFIEKVLVKFGFKVCFVNTFKLLYNQITSRVLINGFVTDSFPILRSVKQGDALSCVLFILCMEIVIKNIELNSDINPIISLNTAIPKVLAYADDIAILVANVESINLSINAYNEFSRCSGLYLNVDKTEILKLNPKIGPDFTVLSQNNERINFIKKMVICGRTFSCDILTEYEYNISNKIDKLQKALNAWNRRSLSIFGRNIILKTFGLSQLIYSMQNSVFDEKDIKAIERICYNFLWNKKADKAKAYERISRKKLKCPYNAGGINSPDINCLNKALKIMQLIRSTSENNKHFINSVQVEALGFNPNLLFQKINFKSANTFVNSSVNILAELGSIMVDEINNSNEDNRISKNYYTLIASESMVNFVNKQTSNPIIRLNAKLVEKKLGILNVGQLINEFKFPSTDFFRDTVSSIINSCGPTLKILTSLNELSYGLSFRDCLFLSTNKSFKESQLSTKLIKQRLFFKAESPVPIPSFKVLKKIIHPKEREVAFLRLHHALLPNTKLYAMKLINSPLCEVCNDSQDTEHIFESCINVDESILALAKYQQFILSNPSVRNNINALINRLLYMNRNKPLKADFFCKAIDNRLNDLDKLLQFKKRKKDLNDINKLTMA